MPESSVYMTLYDKMSPTLKSIGNNTRAFQKELQGLEQACAAYEKKQAVLVKDISTLKSKLTESNEKVKEARKAWLAHKDVLTKGVLDKAIAEQEEYKAKLKDTEVALKDEQTAVRNLANEIRKGENSGGMGGGLGKFRDGLRNNELIKMGAAAISNLAGSVIESAIGVPQAKLLSETVSGIGQGAAAGMLAGTIFGLPGWLVGGSVGAVAGFANGWTQIREKQDDYFKSYYADLYENSQERITAGLSEGSGIRGGREQTEIAFAKRFGSEEEALSYLDRVKEMAVETNYSYDEIVGYSKKLLNSYDAEAVFGVLQKLSDASAGLDLSSSDVDIFIAGLSRMRTTGKATQEYLNYFSERGVDVYSALSSATGADKTEIAEMVRGGKITGETAAQAILDYIEENYGGLSKTLAGTYEAMADNLEDTMANVKEGYGEGYNEERKKGIAAETETYGGALGDAMKELNSIAGGNQAWRENLQEQYLREALSAVLLGQGTTLYDEETAAKLAEMGAEYVQMQQSYEDGDRKAGLRMETLRSEAENLAQAAYDSDKGIKEYKDVQLELVAATRELTGAFDGWQASYQMDQEKSKGQWSVPRPVVTGISTGGTGTYVVSGLSLAPGGTSAYGAALNGGHAWGLPRVPYDNFPALLHQGERVLTAQEARAADRESAGSITVTVTGNSFVGTGEEMADQLMRIINRKLQREALLRA